MKAKVHEDNWQTKNLQQFETSIRKCLKEMDPAKIQKKIDTVIKIFDDFRRNDIIENKK